MTPAAALLVDALGRVAEDVAGVLDGLDETHLSARVGTGANPIGWLVWHLTRVQDDHVAGVAGSEQVWSAEGYVGRFGLPLDAADLGYGHTSEQVAAVRGFSAELLREYHDATYRRSAAYLGTISDADLGRVVDERWDPPVTLGVRLVSVANDCAQHVGQAAYVRGLLTGWRPASG
ncbi:DUF664 domain-containing protein [Nocardioides sp. GY 10113]|uniref:mycothiol transferase n=1 Tax=Nocardioides sp. GY 10113 TaxID=2569761 RepID=UPI0010A94227|nr:DUF664 domain-containing protein [Nocardioides sp. GY 10113]TIC88966.1 DUF664 domain-containing protein [Nocardioides sp. GY 10113]